MKEMCNTCNIANTRRCSFCETSDKFVLFVLQITDRCNEKCDFCWYNGKEKYQGADMKREDIDLLIKHIKTKTNKFPALLFSGGEPLLHVDLIEYALTRMDRVFPKYLTTVVTNGMIYSERLVELSQKYNLKFVITLPTRHSRFNVERTESIKKYLSIKDKIRLNFLITIQESEIEDLYTELVYWKSLGVPSVTIKMECHTDRGLEEDPEVTSRYKEACIDCLRLIDDTFYIGNFIPRDVRTSDGLERYAYHSDGKFYLTTKDKFYGNSPVGDVISGINPKELYELTKDIPCSSCTFRGLCNEDPGYFRLDNKIIKNKRYCGIQRVERYIAMVVLQNKGRKFYA